MNHHCTYEHQQTDVLLLLYHVLWSHVANFLFTHCNHAFTPKTWLTNLLRALVKTMLTALLHKVMKGLIKNPYFQCLCELFHKARKGLIDLYSFTGGNGITSLLRGDVKKGLYRPLLPVLIDIIIS